jgi:hypothetical protein
MDHEEKRAHSRFALWFPIKVDTLSAGRTNGIVCDASAGGVLVNDATELVVGEAVTISFEVPGEGEKFYLGKIVRLEGDDGKERRVAIAFVEPAPELEKLFTRASIVPPPMP